MRGSTLAHAGHHRDPGPPATVAALDTGKVDAFALVSLYATWVGREQSVARRARPPAVMRGALGSGSITERCREGRQCHSRAHDAPKPRGAMKTDVHNHAVPESVVEFLAREPAFGIRVTGERHLSGGPEGEYELQPAFFDADAKVAELEAHDLEAAVISVDPPFFHYDVDAGAGAALAELVNEGLRDICARRPDRLAWMATVPLQDPQRAADMLRAQKRAGCVGVEIGSSTGVKPLDHADIEPFWAAAEELGLPVMIHPAYQHAHPGFDSFHLTNVIGNMLETTIAIERLMMAGVLDRHPSVRVQIVHSGGYVAWQQGRLRHARSVRPYAASAPTEPAAYFGQVVFDCLTHDRDALRFLLSKVGVDNVMLGTDLPCDMAAPDPWNDLLAVAGEDVAKRVAEDNPTRLYGLERREASGVIAR